MIPILFLYPSVKYFKPLSLSFPPIFLFKYSPPFFLSFRVDQQERLNPRPEESELHSSNEVFTLSPTTHNGERQFGVTLPDVEQGSSDTDCKRNCFNCNTLWHQITPKSSNSFLNYRYMWERGSERYWRFKPVYNCGEISVNASILCENISAWFTVSLTRKISENV